MTVLDFYNMAVHDVCRVLSAVPPYSSTAVCTYFYVARHSNSLGILKVVATYSTVEETCSIAIAIAVAAWYFWHDAHNTDDLV